MIRKNFVILKTMETANVKKISGLIFAAMILFFASAQIASAHLPCLERGSVEIKIDKPEVSKAHYGWLEGEPAVYRIDSKEPFLLYVNLLSPRVESGHMDYSAAIYKDGEIFAKAVADDSFWLVIYEPFANDYYAKGPEFEQKVGAGKYEIKVYNSGNSGNYVLAVGKTEDLSLGEFLRTLAVLPVVKEEFFGKNWWEAYNNLVGLMALIALAVFLMVFYFVFSFFRRRRMKKILDIKYAEHKNGQQNHWNARGEDCL